MGIRIHRHADRAVTKNFLYYFRVNAHTEQDRRRTMSEIMKAQVGKACLLEHSRKHLQDIAGIEIISMQATEGQIMLLPSCSHFEAQLQLLNTVLLQHVDDKGRECDLASPFRCLRFGLDIPVPGDEVYRAAYLETLTFKVDVRPPECEQLTTPQASRQRHSEHCFQTMSACGLQ